MVKNGIVHNETVGNGIGKKWDRKCGCAGHTQWLHDGHGIQALVTFDVT